MFFIVKNKHRTSTEHLRTSTMLRAYYIIQKYPIHASEQILDQFIQQQYKITLKDMCVKLLLNTTFFKDDSGNLVLMFKENKFDKIAQLITYGNGAIPGSRILQVALKD